MNALKYILFLFILFGFSCCRKNIEVSKPDKKQEVSHFLERYCFQDGRCTNTVYVGGSDLNVASYFEDECTLKPLDFRFLEDTVFIKPILLKEIDDECFWTQFSHIFFILGNSIIYDNYFKECLGLENVIKGEVDEHITDGFLTVLKKRYSVNLNLIVDSDICLDFKKLNLKTEKLDKLTYSLEFKQKGFYLKLTINDLDFNDPENYFFKDLIMRNNPLFMW